MKHFFLIMAALLSLAACKRDDDPASPIVGTWKLTGIKVLDGKNILNVLYSNPADGCTGKDTFVFNTDGTAVNTQHRFEGPNCRARTYNYTYSYNTQTKELTLTQGGGTPQTKEVVKLDNNTFEYVYNISDENSDGTPDKVVHIYTRAN